VARTIAPPPASAAASASASASGSASGSGSGSGSAPPRLARALLLEELGPAGESEALAPTLPALARTLTSSPARQDRSRRSARPCWWSAR
jgi:hypothetical protein